MEPMGTERFLQAADSTLHVSADTLNSKLQAIISEPLPKAPALVPLWHLVCEGFRRCSRRCEYTSDSRKGSPKPKPIRGRKDPRISYPGLG